MSRCTGFIWLWIKDGSSENGYEPPSFGISSLVGRFKTYKDLGYKIRRTNMPLLKGGIFLFVWFWSVNVASCSCAKPLTSVNNV